MLHSVPKCTAIVIVAGGCALFGLHPLAMFLFAAPVAVYWRAGFRPRALALVLGAGGVGALAGGAVGLGISYALIAALGVLLAELIARRQSYGRCVGAVTAAALGLLLLGIVPRWSLFRDAGLAWMAGPLRDFEAESSANAFAANAVLFLRWFSENWDHVVLGSLFGGVLLGAVFLVSLTLALMRRAGLPRLPVGAFSRLRPPEWLVWVAIAVALGWFMEQRWPNEALRMLTWNMALGLAFVYWLNGFSCLVFALNILRPGPVLYYLAVFLVFLLGIHTVVATFGLFDTWWDFRRKLRKVAVRRRLRAQSGDPET